MIAAFNHMMAGSTGSVSLRLRVDYPGVYYYVLLVPKRIGSRFKVQRLQRYIQNPFDNSWLRVFQPRMLAIDKSIVASCHSHPSGNLNPSINDRAVFSRFKLNLIIGPPHTIHNIKAYNADGREIQFRLI